MFTCNHRRMKNYHDTIDRTSENTLCFENISDKYEYSDPNIFQFENTARKLTIYDNRILRKFIPLFTDQSQLKIMTNEDHIKYRFRPKWLSLDQYGSTDFWWIILAVNGFNSDLEFENFTSLWITDKDTIVRTIDNELYNKPIKYELSSDI